MYSHANTIKSILRKEEAWDTLPRETRQTLYDLLPAPRGGEPPHDVDVHPLKTAYKQYIEDGIRTWQQDLIDGREAKSWREQAMQAEKDREEGKWDEFKDYQRYQEWGDDDEEEDSKTDEKDELSEGDGITVSMPKTKTDKGEAIKDEAIKDETVEAETVKAASIEYATAKTQAEVASKTGE